MSDNNDLIPAIEAVLFASGAPVAKDRLCEILAADDKSVSSALDAMQDKYSTASFGITLITVEGAYQLCTKSEYAPYVKAALEMRKLPPLSRAALEVLAIIAYNAPVTRSFIEQVRGTDSSSIVSSLTDKGLVRECGYLDAPGRPSLFCTTDAFLRCFGLSSLEDLPQAGELPHSDGQESMSSLLDQETDDDTESEG